MSAGALEKTRSTDKHFQVIDMQMTISAWAPLALALKQGRAV